MIFTLKLGLRICFWRSQIGFHISAESLDADVEYLFPLCLLSAHLL